MNAITSILLPVYNSEKTIDRCLSSIFNQIIKVDEIIIVNDGSTDLTENKIMCWKQKLPIKYFKNKKNMGIPYTLRKAINFSSGKLLFRIDADDEWRKIHIKEIMNLYKKNNAAIYTSKSQYYKEDLTPIYTSKDLSDSSIREYLMWDNPMVHSSIAFKKSIYFLTNGYGNDKIAQDYHLIIELLDKGKLAFTNKITVNYFVNKSSISRVNLRSARRGRFIGQMKAILYFWKRHPLNAIKIIPILFFRILFRR